MSFIYSTMTAGVTYTSFKKVEGGIGRPHKQVIIHGGANNANKNRITPIGVETEVSEEDLAFLLENPVFKRHQENKFLVVFAKSQRIEKAVQDLQAADKSAPLTPADLNGEISDDSLTTIDLRVPKNGVLKPKNK
jgi:hypothetical protein